jgi:hypothetical protein
MVVSRRRHGACAALLWSEAQKRYVCGVLVLPSARLRRRSRWLAQAWTWLARRWIAAGKGCDAMLEVDAAE